MYPLCGAAAPRVYDSASPTRGGRLRNRRGRFKRWTAPASPSLPLAALFLLRFLLVSRNPAPFSSRFRVRSPRGKKKKKGGEREKERKRERIVAPRVRDRSNFFLYAPIRHIPSCVGTHTRAYANVFP